MKLPAGEKSHFYRKVFCVSTAIVAWFAGYARADLTITGDPGFSFSANFDSSNNITGYVLAGESPNIQFNVPSVTVPIGILPFYRHG